MPSKKIFYDKFLLDLIRTLYLNGFSVHTYDHQSQGLSGRWLSDQQSTWIHSFDDYVDDFVYFMTMISRENNSRPIHVVAHSMGCLVSAIGISRHPALVSRVVFSAPMIRNKCGTKYFDYKFPLPQPIVYWATYLSCYFGLGSMHAIGFLKEKSTDKITLKLTTDKYDFHINIFDIYALLFCYFLHYIFFSIRRQLDNYVNLRQRYPSIISACATNDWVLQSLRAQYKFSHRYELFRANTLILMAQDDVFVYNRAIHFFAGKAPSCR